MQWNSMPLETQAGVVSQCVPVYAVVKQDSETTQGLEAAKARLAKQRLTIPRLVLVVGHMAINRVDNISCALDGFPVTSVHCWLDSSVALHWIRSDGEYKQLVAKSKIMRSKGGDTCRLIRILLALGVVQVP